AGCFSGLPGAHRHNSLRPFAGGEIGAERHRVRRAAFMGDLQGQRRAGVVMPDLDRIDAMPVRAVAAPEQEIDRGRMRAAIAVDGLVAEGLAIVAALRMRPELETRDDLGGRQHQDLFLRSRSSPNTSTAPAPFMCSFCATAGSSARRNTLAFFSSPSSEG